MVLTEGLVNRPALSKTSIGEEKMVAVEKIGQIVEEIYRRDYVEENPDYSETASLDEKVRALFFEGDLPSCLTNLLEIAVRLTGAEGVAVVPHWTGVSGVYYGQMRDGEYISFECGPDVVEEISLSLWHLTVKSALGNNGVSKEVSPEFPAVILFPEGRKYPVELPVLALDVKGYWFERFSELEEFLKETLSVLEPLEC